MLHLDFGNDEQLQVANKCHCSRRLRSYQYELLVRLLLWNLAALLFGEQVPQACKLIVQSVRITMNCITGQVAYCGICVN